MNSKYQIIIINEFDTELETMWKLFEKSSAGYFFQTHDWLYHWYRTIGRPKYSVVPFVVTVYYQSRLIAILPFSIRKVTGFKVLEWLGGDQTDYMAGLYSTDRKWSNNEIEEIWKLINNRLFGVDVIHLRKQPYYILDSRTNKNRDLINPFWKLHGAKVENTSYSLRLSHTGSDFSQHLLSGNVRRDTKRKIRRIAEIGTVTFMSATNERDHEDILLAMIHQKRRRYKDTKQPDLLADERVRQFYSECPNNIGTRGNVHCAALRVNNELVATHWGVVSDNIFYWLMPSFESGSWAKYSPGRVLLYFLVEWSVLNQLDKFDLTIGQETYKQKWSDSTMPLFEHLTPLTLRGRLYVLYRRLHSYRATYLKLILR